MNEPITLHVVLTPSDEVTSLRDKISTLEVENLRLTKELKRCENNLMFEYQVNQKIVDYCREHGLTLPKHFFYRLGQ